METGVSRYRRTRHTGSRSAGQDVANEKLRECVDPAVVRGDVTMEPEESSERWEGAAAHPLAELLACPPPVANLLNASAESIEFEAGDSIFRQSSPCRGLYVVVAGNLQRKAERMESRLTLGPVRVGELVELAAALGDGNHTYTLTAQSSGSMVFLPIEALRTAFQAHPPLRMQLLEELAREVSRAYALCCVTRMTGMRRRSAGIM